MERISKKAAQEFLPPGFSMDPKFPAEGAECGAEHVQYMLGIVWPLLDSYRKVLVAQRAMSTYTTIGMFAVGDRDLNHIGAGHVFYLDYPGKGKTLLANVPAVVVGSTASRFQGVPDAVPADYLGSRIIQLNEVTGKREFQTIKGPAFADIQVLDEFNRNNTRTQSAALQVLGENRITIGNETYEVDPFAIITANPVEQEGTFPLSEAFLDRIMFQIRGQEFTAGTFAEILERTRLYDATQLAKVCEIGQVHEVRRFFHKTIHVTDDVADRIGRFAERANAPHTFGFLKDIQQQAGRPIIKVALSGRGAVHLEGAARTLAAFRYRNFVTPDDVLKVLLPVMRHRVIFETGVLKHLQTEYGHRDTLETIDYILLQLIKEAW